MCIFLLSQDYWSHMEKHMEHMRERLVSITDRMMMMMMMVIVSSVFPSLTIPVG